MQNRRWVAMAVFLGITLAAGSVWAELKVGVVDFRKALELSAEGKKAKAIFQTKVEKIQQELKEKQDRLAAVKSDLDRQASMLSATARADKERDYQDKLRDFKRLYEDYQEDMQRQDAELSEKILSRMIEVVQDMGVKEGYDLILEKNQGVLYGSNSIDLTDQVIKLFDKSSKNP